MGIRNFYRQKREIQSIPDYGNGIAPKAICRMRTRSIFLHKEFKEPPPSESSDSEQDENSTPMISATKKGRWKAEYQMGKTADPEDHR